MRSKGGFRAVFVQLLDAAKNKKSPAEAGVMWLLLQIAFDIGAQAHACICGFAAQALGQT